MGPVSAGALFILTVALGSLDVAREQVAAGDQKAAIETLEEVRRTSPDDVEARRLLVELLSWNEGGARIPAVLEELVALLPDDEALARELAQHYIWNGRAADAAPLYERLSTAHPEDRELLDKLAQIYGWTSQAAARIEVLERIHRLAPDDDAITAELAQQYEWNSRGEEAIPLLERLVQQTPRDPALRLRLARQLAAHGSQARAVSHLRQVVKATPDDTDARFLLGQICHWSDCWLESRTQYREILARRPDHEPAIAASIDLRRTRGARLPARFEFFSDSNDVSRITAETGFETPLNQTFSLEGIYRHQRLIEGGSSARGELDVDELDLRLLTRLPAGIQLNAGVGGQYVWPSGPALTAHVEAKASAFGWMYMRAQWRRQLHANRIQSLEARIGSHRLEASVYAEPVRWFAASAAVVGDLLDDGNRLLTVFAGAWATPLRDPVEIRLGVTTGFEDSAEIFEDALPYYTAPAVLIVAPGVDLAWAPIDGLRLSAGYSANLSPRFGLAHGPRGEVRWEITRFDTLVANYNRTGASVYSSDLASLRFEHRFP